MNQTIQNQCTDNKDLQKQVESQNLRIKVLENLISAAKHVMTLAETATFMGISKSSLYKMTSNHEIPFYRPNGKLIYFEKEDVLLWMRQNREASAEELNNAAVRQMSGLAYAKA